MKYVFRVIRGNARWVNVRLSKYHSGTAHWGNFVELPARGTRLRGTILRGTVRRGNVFGKLFVGKIYVGEKSVGKKSVRELP